MVIIFHHTALFHFHFPELILIISDCQRNSEPKKVDKVLQVQEAIHCRITVQSEYRAQTWLRPAMLHVFLHASI